MSRVPDLQFAVVREDPAVELDALQGARPGSDARSGPPRVLLVGSAGCTALALHNARPDARFTLVDPNPAQHAHVEAKLRALVDRAPLGIFNVGSDDPAALSECGNFESLFRQLRSFLREFVVPARTVEAAVCGGETARVALVGSAWWPVAFDLFFSDSLLVAMFGPAAIQHAAPGSYPRYFQRVFEGLLADAGTVNCEASASFLRHLLCGSYEVDALPAFLRSPLPSTPRFEHVLGGINAIPDFGLFDVVHLSNVLDWTDRDEATGLAARISEELRPGARVTLRQLNNEVPVEEAFPMIAFGPAVDASGFYNRVLIGAKSATPPPATQRGVRP